jgi:hypothetical protein
MPTAIRVSGDRAINGKVVASTYGEIVVSVTDGRVVLVADANWGCDQFSMQPDDAWRLDMAICEGVKGTECT